MQCKAKSKRTGEQCRRRAVTGYEVCQVHGGVTPSGVASPHWKTGAQSRIMPTRLLERYGESLTDPDLLALRKEIALCDARLDDLLQRVDTNEAGALWSGLRQAYNNLTAANDAGDAVAAASALNDIGRYISRGQGDYAAWGEIAHWQEHRRRLSETEAKRLVSMQQMISSEKAMALITSIGLIIKRHVTDRDALRAIVQELRALIGRSELVRPGDQPTPVPIQIEDGSTN
jgi:hypothetical protein